MKTIAKVWTFKSSSGAGIYETLQYNDKSTSCNCPGWTRRIQPDGSRSCKHTRLIDQGLADSECVSSKSYDEPMVSAPVEKPAASTGPKADAVARKIQWR